MRRERVNISKLALIEESLLGHTKKLFEVLMSGNHEIVNRKSVDIENGNC